MAKITKPDSVDPKPKRAETYPVGTLIYMVPTDNSALLMRIADAEPGKPRLVNLNTGAVINACHFFEYLPANGVFKLENQ